ncbi:uncharacterized protein [Argopecten irradians]|uniref:uncharacterized protein n=1 Tax=Argopecten irradians TaxID=31199 RepID=UPI00371F208D
MNVAVVGKVNLVLGALAIIFQIIGFATRGWIRFKFEVTLIDLGGQFLTGLKQVATTKFEFGLWSVSSCIQGVCFVLKHTDWESNSQVNAYADMLNIRQYKIITSLAVGFGIVAMIFLVLHFRRPVLTNRCNGFLAISCFSIAGVLMWYVVGKFAKMAANLHPILTEHQELTAMAPYSVVLAAIGASLAFAVAIMVFLEVFRTSCLAENGTVISRFPGGQQQHTLLSISHQTTMAPPPMMAQTTHINVR